MLNFFTQDHLRSLKHALLHLENNRILDDQSGRGWYRGKREDFCARHVRSMRLLRTMICIGEACDIDVDRLKKEDQVTNAMTLVTEMMQESAAQKES